MLFIARSYSFFFWLKDYKSLDTKLMKVGTKNREVFLYVNVYDDKIQNHKDYKLWIRANERQLVTIWMEVPCTDLK